ITGGDNENYKNITTGGDNEKTYLVRSEFLDSNTIDDMFTNLKNWTKCTEIPKSNYIDFIYIDGVHAWKDRDLWDVKSDIKSLIGHHKDQLSDKAKLYQFANDYMMEQEYVNFDDINTHKIFFDKHDVVILKPVHGYK